uniref:Hypothetical membrane-like protein n=1 Tax=Rhinella marina erythrocytic-like virus TaxID=2859906 RepID=A0A8F6YI65_9VIRU|nr:hypothetical membrane-like protein [Rhinella marina erythrocytic-like virus]
MATFHICRDDNSFSFSGPLDFTTFETQVIHVTIHENNVNTVMTVTGFDSMFRLLKFFSDQAKMVSTQAKLFSDQVQQISDQAKLFSEHAGKTVPRFA